MDQVHSVKEVTAAKITSAEVAERIARLGPAFKELERTFIDCCVDGALLDDFSKQSENDVLTMLETGLGISNALLRRRIFIELKQIWSNQLFTIQCKSIFQNTNGRCGMLIEEHVDALIRL